jgi:hypothetical protein
MFKIGDEVRILDTENRDYYKQILTKKGKIAQITNYKHFADDVERMKYYVEIPEFRNEFQSDGLWVFHNDMSISLTSNELTCDDQMDAYEYAISPFGLGKVLCDRDYIIKGEKQNMMTGILSIYEEKQSRKINKKYDDLEQSIKLTDERYKTWLECTTTLTNLYKEDKVFMCEQFPSIQLSKETLAKLHTLYDTREEDLRKLCEKRREVQSQLDMCDTYDQKQEILRRYNIINKNGKVNG